MNSAQTLYCEYGILSELDSSGRVIFSGVGKFLPTISGNDAVWQEVRRLMIDVERNAQKYLQRNDKIIVTGQRQTLVLYPGEIRGLLQHDPDLYIKALKRGKHERRTQASERRRAEGK